MDKLQTSRDPVCGMDVTVADSQYSTTLRGLAFHFCSVQCQERFALSPALYTGSKRTADIEPIPKSRKLQIVSATPEMLRHACEKLLQMKGISLALPGDGHLLVEYDLWRATLGQIEAVLSEAGISLKGGLHGFRRGWWRFGESNEIENVATSGGACCNRPPARLR